MSEQFNSQPPSDAPAPTLNAADANAPQASTAETLTGIFFEPGNTFDALRARPRFLVAALIITAVFMLFYVAFIQRVGGMEAIAQARIEASNPDISPEDRERALQVQNSPVVKAISYAAPLIFFPLFFAVGGALYMLGTAAMGGKINYKQALSVWTYSSLPPTLLVMLINILLLFVKPDIDPVKDANGLAQANPSFLVDGTARPILATILKAPDLFVIYGLFLAALGLRKVGRLSSGAAWGLALAIFLLGLAMRIVFAAATGNPS